MIVIDTREKAIDAELLYDEGADDVQEEHLSTGDFLVNDYIIERKKYGDFIGRITQSERDLWQQVLAMESAADKHGYTPILMLEGEWSEPLQWSNLTPAAPTNALFSVIKLGIMTVHTCGPRASAQGIVKLEDDTEHDVGSIRDSPSVPPELYPRYITESFTGVGPSRAEDLLNKYGTFANLVQTLVDDPDDVLAVDGIGEATRDKMVKMVNQEWE